MALLIGFMMNEHCYLRGGVNITLMAASSLSFSPCPSLWTKDLPRPRIFTFVLYSCVFPSLVLPQVVYIVPSFLVVGLICALLCIVFASASSPFPIVLLTLVALIESWCIAGWGAVLPGQLGFSKVRLLVFVFLYLMLECLMFCALPWSNSLRQTLYSLLHH